MNETKKDNMSQEQNHYPQSNGATSEHRSMTALSQSQQSSDSSQIHDDAQPQVSSEDKPQPSDTSSFFKGLFIVKFTGRMRRQDFLLSLLCLILLVVGFFVAVGLTLSGARKIIYIYRGAYSGIIFIGYAVSVALGMAVRRLHDVGKSGAVLILIYIPFFGPLIFLLILLTIMCCRDSQYGPNRWGG